MAFRFKRKESVSKAVCRITQERISCALKAVAQEDKFEAVHRVRMEIKKVRSILRLIRKATINALYNDATAGLREAANSLGPVRDAHVTLQAFTELIGQFKQELPASPFKEIRHTLQQECRRAMADFEAQSASKVVARNLRKVQQQFREVQLCAKSWDVLGPGLQWSYNQARGCKSDFLKNGSALTLHEWRKRVKDLWYQVRLLRCAWPEQMCAMSAELKALSDYLGDDHDLVLLRETVENMAVDREEQTVLCGLIAQRQQQLRSAALLLGTRFYAEKPAIFTDRLCRYWSIWRRNQRKLKRQARASVR